MRSNKPNTPAPDFFSILRNTYVQIGIILLTLFLFVITKNIIFGFLIAVEIIGIVAFEVTSGVKKHGLRSELKETAIALVVALLLWFGAMFVLQTSSPISAVASCSMLPNLDRGDFVIVQGSSIGAYEINLTKDEFKQLLEPAMVGNKSFTGSIYAYCLQKSDPICADFIAEPSAFEEKRGPLTFYYANCIITTSGKKTYEPCVSLVGFKGKNYTINFSHDVVVYQPTANEIYSLIGDIVHRSQFKLNVDGEAYYLTKGDNNPIFDIQVFDYKSSMGNYPISQERVKGKVVGRVPYLGYLKLFISGLFAEPAQCKTQLEY